MYVYIVFCTPIANHPKFEWIHHIDTQHIPSASPKPSLSHSYYTNIILTIIYINLFYMIYDHKLNNFYIRVCDKNIK